MNFIRPAHPLPAHYFIWQLNGHISFGQFSSDFAKHNRGHFLLYTLVSDERIYNYSDGPNLVISGALN